MDEYGVEEALRLREGAAAGAEVIALAIGPARSEEIDLIFFGGQQADWDSHALGPATAPEPQPVKRKAWTPKAAAAKEERPKPAEEKLSDA